MKKFKFLVLTLGICFLLTANYAEAVEISDQPYDYYMEVDGELVKATQIILHGQIVQGRFLVPMRDIFEALGTEVEWNGQTRSVTGVRDNTTVTLTIDNKQAKINNRPTELEVPPTIINDRTFVPARFVGEALGANVEWDANKRMAKIVYETTEIRVFETPVKQFSLDQEGEIHLKVGEEITVKATVEGEGLSFEEKYVRWGINKISIANIYGSVVSGYMNAFVDDYERFITTSDNAVIVKAISPGQAVLSASVGPLNDNRSLTKRITVIVSD